MPPGNFHVFLARHRRTHREREFYRAGLTRQVALAELVEVFPDWIFYL